MIERGTHEFYSQYRSYVCDSRRRGYSGVFTVTVSGTSATSSNSLTVTLCLKLYAVCFAP